MPNMNSNQCKITYSRKKESLDLLMQSPDLADWSYVSRRKWAAPLMAMYPEYIIWDNLPERPWSLAILRTNEDSIDWKKVAKSKFAKYAKAEFPHKFANKQSYNKTMTANILSFGYSAFLLYYVVTYMPIQSDASSWCDHQYEWFGNSTCKYRPIPLIDKSNHTKI